MHEDKDESPPRAVLVGQRHWLLVLLAFHAGALDALGFLALQAFTSVQTGNMVLLGIGAATSDGSLAFHAVAAIACFALGCFLGARIAGARHDEDGVWPREVTTALLVQLVALVVFAVLWWAVDSDPGPTAKVVFLTMNSLGMGIQSGATQRFGSGGESTTYSTGALNGAMSRLATVGWSERSTRSLHIFAAMVLGALVGALLLEQAPWSPPLLQIGTLALVIVLARRRLERAQ